MRKLILMGLLISITSFLFSQPVNKIINAKKVKRIEKVLSADDMQGRRAFTPGSEKAAAFIAEAFKKAGLQMLPGSSSYFQQFTMTQPKLISLSGTIDDIAASEKNTTVISSATTLKVTPQSGFSNAAIKKGDNLIAKAKMLINKGENLIVAVDPGFSGNFSRLSTLKRNLFKSDKSVVFVLAENQPKEFNIELVQEVKESKLMNVVGMLPGKSKKDEYVIFSGHYDHLGIGKPNEKGDSIFNGANDDAAGTTAVIMLARYFAKHKKNERTILFAAFTAEEVGGYGATYFSRQLDPAKVMAMFNIEMIGTESKWGTNSAYITGYEKSDMGEILQKNLTGSKFTFHPDPYTSQNLFYRSDNATLARLGVPAHTISTSKMDSEKYYHTQEDEMETLDMKNMAEIIKAIALSSTTIVNGEDTPTRVNIQSLDR